QCHVLLSHQYDVTRELHSFPTRRSSDLQRVVRAAEYQRVDVALDQRGKVFPGDALHLGAGRLSALDQLDETRTRLLEQLDVLAGDRKSTRLNSSHLVISYAVFCLKKKRN